ncbi:MAG: formylglycine-generating enzyme family protein [Phycisphaeraceae bacterium]
MKRKTPRLRSLVTTAGFSLLACLLNGCGSAPGPDRFTDEVRYVFDFEKKNLRGSPILLEAVPIKMDRREHITFEMTRIPGDAERGVAPFYLSTTEVPANLFFPWATGEGLKRKDLERWASYDLHPSRMSEAARLYGPPNRPAMGMSRRAAELYCDWLSQHTGRRYRLPTQAEWEHALRLSGGVPKQRATLLDRATLADNAKEQADPPWFPVPSAVGARQPDALGLHDLLGNAAEWVTGTGDERVVRGGHFMVKPDELSSGWRWVEDLQVWNASFPYPIDPDDTAYWYRDFYYTGIRLACDEGEAPGG